MHMRARVYEHWGWARTWGGVLGRTAGFERRLAADALEPPLGKLGQRPDRRRRQRDGPRVLARCSATGETSPHTHTCTRSRILSSVAAFFSPMMGSKMRSSGLDS
jgi:hypothetical protein